MSSGDGSSCLSVVRIGPTTEDTAVISPADLLRKAIVQNVRATTEQQSSSLTSATPTTAPTGEDYLFLSNRYFDATVVLQTIEDVMKKTNDDGDCDDPTTLRQEEGAILVFDATPPSASFQSTTISSTSVTFDGLHTIHEAVDGTIGDALRLCVGINMSATSSTSEAEYSRRILWCLDRGYEYVEVPLASLQYTPDHPDFQVRDKDGFPRVMEAISTTVWASAVRKKPTNSRTPATASNTTAAGLAASILTEELEKTSLEDKPNKEENGYVPPDPSMLLSTNQSSSPVTQSLDPLKSRPNEADEAEDRRREALAREALLPSSSLDTKQTLATKSQNDAAGGTTTSNLPEQQNEEEREQERMLDSLEGALRQAASIRELSRSGNMTDEERRQRAGDAATVLMSLMGMTMDDEEDEEDYENDENQYDNEDPASPSNRNDHHTPNAATATVE